MDEKLYREIAKFIIENPDKTVDITIGDRIDEVTKRSEDLARQFSATISDDRTAPIIAAYNPSLIINVTCITGTMTSLLKLREDNTNFVLAYLGFNNKLAEKIIKDTELLVAQMTTFLDEYRKIIETNC